MTDTEDSSKGASEIDAQIIELTRQPIDLYKILKFEGLVGSGGEAKAAIADGHVMLNNVVETQKRKKIVSGDVIEFAGERYQMHCEAPLIPAKESTGAAKTDHESSVAKATSDRENTEKPKSRKPAPKKTPKKAGRKAIGIKS